MVYLFKEMMWFFLCCVDLRSYIIVWYVVGLVRYCLGKLRRKDFRDFEDLGLIKEEIGLVCMVGVGGEVEEF